MSRQYLPWTQWQAQGPLWTWTTALAGAATTLETPGNADADVAANPSTAKTAAVNTNLRMKFSSPFEHLRLAMEIHIAAAK